MFTRTHQGAAALLIAGAFAVGGTAEAAKKNIGDGLIVVQVGDITVTDAVDVNVAASVAATLCDIADVGSVAVLGVAVDASGKKETVCRTDAGPVTLRNNK
jgi:hypothetical protein